MPAAANRQQPTPPTPRGRGNNSSRQSDKSEREGVGREEKDIPHLYRSRGTLRIYPIQSQLRNRQASRPWVGIEKYDDEKNRPRRSQRKEKTKERAGAKHPQALSEGGNKQLIAKNHSKKTINEPWIRHKKHYTRRHPSNQPIGRTSTKSTHSLPPSPTKQATPSPPPPARGRPRRAAMNPDAQAPRSPTRLSGAGKREERGSETGSEPQPMEQARANDHRADRRR